MIPTQNSTTDSGASRAGGNPDPRVTNTQAHAPPGRPEISATERWVLITDNVYCRAQRRGFVGGDPFEDVAEAIKEIDDEYVTDIRGMLSLTDPVEMVEQFRALFAGFGLDRHSLNKLVAMHREGLEQLADSNRALENGAADNTASRAAFLTEATEDAMAALSSAARSAARFKRRQHFPGRPTEAALRSVLARLSVLAYSLEELVTNGRSAREEKSRSAQQPMEIHGGLIKSYDGMTAAELAKAPIDALKGVSRATAERLASAFGMETIRDMSNSAAFEQAQGIVTLADAEQFGMRGGDVSSRYRALTRLAEGPVHQLESVSRRQADVLQNLFRVETVRDLAQNRFFSLAKAIATLADHET